MGNIRKRYDGKYKMKVVLEFISWRKTATQICSDY